MNKIARYDISKKCLKCNIKFWNLDPNLQYCGNKECNQQELKNKSFVGSLEYTFKSLVEKFKEYYSKNNLFFESSLVMPRCSSLIKVSNTNMNFISAGISSFQTLIDEENPRLNEFGNKLLISNPFVFRFNDLINVGVTKRHNTGFFMFSLHGFETLKKKFPTSWKQELITILAGFYLSLGVPLDKIYLHQDFWTDSVNSGPSVEIFINGIEVGNMVFICNKENEERKLKLLDVGLGAERTLSVITNTPNIYGEDAILDHLRTLIIAFKDKIYPGKTGLSYCIRKRLEFLFEKDMYSKDKVKLLCDPIIKELSEVTGQNFESFYKDFEYITAKEYERYKCML